LTPDLPGRAGHPPATLDGYVDALRASLSPGPRVLAGHSLGAAIALRWALREPEDIRALIVIGAGAKMRVNPRWLEGLARRDAAAVEDFGEGWFAPATEVRLREKSLALLRDVPAEVLLADLRAADAFDAMADIGRLRLPVLIMCGAEDRLTPVKYSRHLHEHIAGSTLQIIEHAGHMVMLEQPRAVNAVIQAFLEGLV
jgi:pimeloyl-ACP methyl ester carboxylesterase